MRRWWERLAAHDTPLVALVVALSVVALWLPDGFADGIYEEWLFLEQYLHGMSAFDVGGQFLRPLVLVPFHLGLALTPGSFTGLNLMLVLVVWGKSMALYLVLRQMDVRSGIAAAASLLFAFYPADDGQMTMRTVGIQASAMLLLVSVSLLLRLVRGGRWYVGLGMAACLAATILGYEAPLPLALVSPSLLLWVDADRRRKLLAAGLWYATLVPLVVRYLYLFRAAKGSYQESLLVVDGLTGFVRDSVAPLSAVYHRILVDGWWLALRNDLASAELTRLLLAVAVAAAGVALVVRLEGRGDATEKRCERRQLLLMAAIGLVVVGIGFAMYLPSNARTTTWRTLFLPSIGGALISVSALRLIAGLTAWQRRIFPSGIGFFVVIGFVHLLAQHHFYAEIGKRQQKVLDGLTAAVPRLSAETDLLLVFDQTDELLSHEYFPFSRYLRAALRPRYGLPYLNVHICYPNTSRRGETCTFDTDGVEVVHQDVGWLAGDLSWQVPYDKMVAVVHDRDGHIRLLDELPPWYTLQEGDLRYRPAALVDRGDGFKRSFDALRVEFDEGAFVAAGWDIERRNNAGVTYRFLSSPVGTLFVPLEPGDYLLEIRIANGITQQLLASVGVAVGGERIELERVDGATFRGRVPERLISASGATLVTLSQDAELLRQVQAERGPLIGLGFDWVSFAPAPPVAGSVELAAGDGDGIRVP